MDRAVTARGGAGTAHGLGQPYETAVIDGMRGPVKVFVNAPATLRQLYVDTVSDHPFLVYEDERWTFREAHAQASSIAHMLVHEMGRAAG